MVWFVWTRLRSGYPDVREEVDGGELHGGSERRSKHNSGADRPMRSALHGMEAIISPGARYGIGEQLRDGLLGDERRKNGWRRSMRCSRKRSFKPAWFI